MKISRRNFLKLVGVGGSGLLIINSRQALASDTTPGKHRWAMVIDQAKCNGCGYCALACRATNDTVKGREWNVVLEGNTVNNKPVFTPRPCMHCDHAPCVEVCPVGATYKRDDGLVAMDYDKCIGCRYCQVACPYEARVFNWEENTQPNDAVPTWGKPEVPRRPRGVPEKCTFCQHRLDRGLAEGLTPGVDRRATPACVNACPMGARIFGDLNDPQSNVSKWLKANDHTRLREDLGTAPRVYYLPKRS
jgi:Fe-S-cluster-containing dehydrogenase component